MWRTSAVSTHNAYVRVRVCVCVWMCLYVSPVFSPRLRALLSSLSPLSLSLSLPAVRMISLDAHNSRPPLLYSFGKILMGS